MKVTVEKQERDLITYDELESGDYVVIVDESKRWHNPVDGRMDDGCIVRVVNLENYGLLLIFLDRDEFFHLDDMPKGWKEDIRFYRLKPKDIVKIEI